MSKTQIHMCLPMLHQDLKPSGPSLAKMSHFPASGFLLISRTINACHQARLTQSIWMVYGLLPTSPIRSQFMVCFFPFSFLGGSGYEALQLGSASAEDNLELFVPHCHYHWNIEITNLLHMPNFSDLSRYTNNIQTLQTIINDTKGRKRIVFYHMLISSIKLRGKKTCEFNFAVTY